MSYPIPDAIPPVNWCIEKGALTDTIWITGNINPIRIVAHKNISEFARENLKTIMELKDSNGTTHYVNRVDYCRALSHHIDPKKTLPDLAKKIESIVNNTLVKTQKDRPDLISFSNRIIQEIKTSALSLTSSESSPTIAKAKKTTPNLTLENPPSSPFNTKQPSDDKEIGTPKKGVSFPKKVESPSDNKRHNFESRFKTAFKDASNQIFETPYKNSDLIADYSLTLLSPLLQKTLPPELSVLQKQIKQRLGESSKEISNLHKQLQENSDQNKIQELTEQIEDLDSDFGLEELSNLCNQLKDLSNHYKPSRLSTKISELKTPPPIKQIDSFIETLSNLSNELKIEIDNLKPREFTESDLRRQLEETFDKAFKNLDVEKSFEPLKTTPKGVLKNPRVSPILTPSKARQASKDYFSNTFKDIFTGKITKDPFLRSLLDVNHPKLKSMILDFLPHFIDKEEMGSNMDSLKKAFYEDAANNYPLEHKDTLQKLIDATLDDPDVLAAFKQMRASTPPSTPAQDL